MTPAQIASLHSGAKVTYRGSAPMELVEVSGDVARVKGAGMLTCSLADLELVVEPAAEEASS